MKQWTYWIGLAILLVAIGGGALGACMKVKADDGEMWVTVCDSPPLKFRLAEEPAFIAGTWTFVPLGLPNQIVPSIIETNAHCFVATGDAGLGLLENME